MYEPSNWSTENEIEHIKKLGTFAARHARNPDRKALLTNYIKSAERRYDWGNVNKVTVITFANFQLSSLDN